MELTGTLENLEAQDFADLIADLGGEVPVLYRRNLGPCPNSVDSLGGFGSPHANCTLCGGTGEFFTTYEAPAQSPTGGVVLLQSVQVGRTVAGVKALEGDCSCLFLDVDYPMGWGDRLCVASRFHQTSEQFKRGEYSTATGLEDPLTTVPVKDIVAVVAPTGLVESDWSLRADGGALVWTGTGATPTAGTNLTVVYRFLPTWRVPEGTTFHRVRADNGDPFPTRCLLRRFAHADTDKTPASIF